MRETQEKNSWLIDLGWVVGITVFAALLRVIYGGAREILIDYSSVGYILRAREIFAGGPFFDIQKMPGYPLLIGFWSAIVGDDILGAKAASIFSGSLLAGMAYLLGKNLYGRSVGITVALLISINVPLIDVAALELAETTYSLAIFTAAAVTVWAVKRQALAIWALAGFLYGISYWVRPEGFFYLGLIPLLAFFEHWFQTKKPFSRDWVLRMSVFLLAGLLLVIPNVLHIHRETGAWTISGRTVWATLIHSTELKDKLAYEKAVLGLTPDKQSIMLEAGSGNAGMFASFLENPGFKVRDMIKNWWKTYNLLTSVFTEVLILFLGIGLFQLKWTFQDRRAEFYLLGSLLPWVIVYPLYEIDYENLAPIVPILSLWAGLGVVSIARRIGPEGRSSRPLLFQKPAVIITAILLLVAFFGLPDYTQPLRQKGFYQGKEDNPVNRKVAEWIKTNLPEDTTLMARKAFIGLYAHRKSILLPFADYEDVIVYARLKGVDVIIMDERFKSFRPQLAFLFEQPTLKDLIPIFTIQNERGSKIILYQLKP